MWQGAMTKVALPRPGLQDVEVDASRINSSQCSHRQGQEGLRAYFSLFSAIPVLFFFFFFPAASIYKTASGSGQ